MPRQTYTRDKQKMLVDWFNDGLGYDDPDNLLAQARRINAVEGFAWHFAAPLNSELVVEGVHYDDDELRAALRIALTEPEV